MGIFSTLQTGVSGLQAAELQIATTGNNISNASSTFYTRQRAVQTTVGHYNYGGVEVGMGTKIDSVVRLHDEYSYSRLKSSSTQLEYTSYLKTKIEEVAKRFPDVKENGVLADLEAYNQAWSSFASAPTDGAQKENLVRVARTLAESLNRSLEDINKIQETINNDIKMTVDEINATGKEIANLNKQINKQEILPTDTANELRDRRDELELKLSKLVDIVTSKSVLTQNSRFESTITDGGDRYSLSISGHLLVKGDSFYPLQIIEDDLNKTSQIVSQGRDEKIIDRTSQISGGKLGAQLDLRGREYIKSEQRYNDGSLQEYKDMLDTFSRTLITQTNNIYASSAKSSLSSNAIKGLTLTNATLGSYDKNIQTGTFDLVVYDAAGNKLGTRSIEINANTTMQDIINQINANVDDNQDNNSLNDIDDLVSAVYQYDGNADTGIFQLNPINPSYKIAIEDKGTNFAGTFGIGGFFSGDSAASIAVKQEYIDNPSELRASANGTDSDNDIANKLVQLQYDKVNFYNKDGTTLTKSLDEYYRIFTGKIATDGEALNNTHATNETLYNSVYEEFQSLNGVNTNEELAALIQYQSSYGAASKIITTIDQMLDTLLGLKS